MLGVVIELDLRESLWNALKWLAITIARLKLPRYIREAIKPYTSRLTLFASLPD
jgi:hypothetical protein